MPSAALSDGTLTLDDLPILTGVGKHLGIEEDPSGAGVFLALTPDSGRQRQEHDLGVPVDLERFTACHRYEPFWMKPAAGSAAAEVPVETQSLLYRRGDGSVVLVIPLCDGVLRSSIQGKGDLLQVVAETGDAHTPAAPALSCFVAVGGDVYGLIPRAAAAVSMRLGTGNLRRDKVLPDFVDHFGWCTWDAFYQDVSEAKVREGLQSFRSIGVAPRMLILDDGWQQEATMPTGERRLTGLRANAKFDGGLARTVRTAKDDFGIQTFLVWHAFIGYWGGVDGRALPQYEVRDVPRRSSLGVISHCPSLQEWWGHLVGVVPGHRIEAFYTDYHRWLAEEGVDGVKVDVQGMLETVSDGSGGRVPFTRAYRRALESSVTDHFDDRLINCMSCATETWYQSTTSNLIRTSTDFWPNKPDSHGLHLYTNAQVCVWFSEFLHADWDMFQSGHPMGAYHAAGRAVSGSPVYVSDKPGQHGAEILRKLVCFDGTTFRCQDIGRPTPDCLFRDPTKEAVLLKIFNRNRHGWVVGAFNARYHANERERLGISGRVSPSDVPGIEGEAFVAWAHEAGLLMRLPRDGRLSLTLGELCCEVVTLVNVVDGCAVVGLADRYNAAAAIAKLSREGRNVEVALRDGGRFLAWCETRPTVVQVEGTAADFSYDAESRALSVDLKPGRAYVVRIVR